MDCKETAGICFASKFYDEVEDEKLKFAVIVATYQNQWILCKHKLRTTYELPGGHRENDETILETAKRELQEETGATQFVIQPVCAYSVLGKTRVNATGNESFGMLYYAKIETLEELHAEIESIALFDEFPLNLTYPLIQPYLLKEVKRRGFIK